MPITISGNKLKVTATTIAHWNSGTGSSFRKKHSFTLKKYSVGSYTDNIINNAYFYIEKDCSSKTWDPEFSATGFGTVKASETKSFIINRSLIKDSDGISWSTVCPTASA